MSPYFDTYIEIYDTENILAKFYREATGSFRYLHFLCDYHQSYTEARLECATTFESQQRQKY